MLICLQWNLAISKLVHKLYHWHAWFWASRRRRNPWHEVLWEDQGGGRICTFCHSFGSYCVNTTQQWELRFRGGQDQQESRNKSFFCPLADNEMSKTKYTAEFANEKNYNLGAFYHLNNLFLSESIYFLGPYCLWSSVFYVYKISGHNYWTSVTMKSELCCLLITSCH